MEDRAALLKGLYTVKHYLQQIQDAQLEEPQFQPELLAEKPYLDDFPHYQKYVHDTQARTERIGARNTPDIVLMTVAMALGIVYLFQALLSGNFVDMVLVGGAVAILYETIGKWSLLRLPALGILIYATVRTVNMVMDMVRSGGPFILVLYLVFFAVAAIVCARVVVVRNRRIDARNEAVDQHNREVEAENRRIEAHNRAEKTRLEQIGQKNHEILMENIQIAQENDRRMERYESRVQAWEEEQRRRIRSLTEELLGLTASWYPRDYYSMYAVDCFLSLVENFRADTVKEMVNLFETDQYRKNMLEKQQELQSLLQQTRDQIEAVNQSVQQTRKSVEQGFQHAERVMEHGFAQIVENQRQIRMDLYFATLAQMQAMNDIESAIRSQRLSYA